MAYALRTPRAAASNGKTEIRQRFGHVKPEYCRVAGPSAHWKAFTRKSMAASLLPMVMLALAGGHMECVG